MFRRFCLTAVLLSHVLVVPRPLHAATPTHTGEEQTSTPGDDLETDVPRLAIEVVPQLGTTNDAVRQAFEERLGQLATEAGLEVVTTDASRLLYIVVGYERDGAATYVVKLAIARDGGGLLRKGEFVCEGCDPDALLDRTSDAVRPLLDELAAPTQITEPEPEPEPRPVDESPSPPQAPPALADHQMPRGWGLFFGGLFFTGFGAAFTIGGAAALIIDASGSSIDNRTLAWSLLGGGLGAVAVGTPMLVIGSKQMYATPHVATTRHSFTLGVSGRF